MPLLMPSVNGFRKRVLRSQAEALCLSALHQARTPSFYEKWEVPDTLEGRFDCASLHMCILLHHLHGPLAQAVFDAFFSYTELTLREMGVGDLSVGKQVKKCARFFYGALKAYTDGLKGTTSLEEALTRNLYGNRPSPWITEVSTYVRTCDQALQEEEIQKMGAPALTWPSLT
jgi:cytochrome b pre-mRNA-processing protein 3